MRTKYCVVEVPMHTGIDTPAPSEYYLGGYETRIQRLAIVFQGTRHIYMTGSKKKCEAEIARIYAGRLARPETDLTCAQS